MRLIEALTLNNLLAEMKITGDNISHATRSSIVKSKIALSRVQAEFEALKATTHKECDGDEKLFRELIEDNLTSNIQVDLFCVTEEELNTLLDCCEMNTHQVELLYNNILLS